MTPIVVQADMCDEQDGAASASKAVEGSALTLESVDDIERGDSLALGVFGICDSVTDDSADVVSSDFRRRQVVSHTIRGRT